MIVDNDQDDIVYPESDIYIPDLLDWLSSNLTRQYYVDEALQNGINDNCFNLLSFAQWLEKQEIMDILLNELENFNE